MRRGDGGPRRRLETLLFTDIVGSTRLAEDLGDRRWRQLLARHHAVVRAVLKRFRGREVDTAGDGFFAVFDQPADAVDAALTAIAELHHAGIEIRAGIHMGEVEIQGSKVMGIAVHVAARVMSQASPGEVLVSGTVRELMSGSDKAFEDRGFHELKGVAAQQHLFSVRGQEVEPEAEPAATLVTDEDVRRPRRRTAVVAVVGVALALALVAVLIPTLGGDRPSETAIPAGIALMDARTWKRLAFVPLSKVKTPAEALYADGHFWVLNLDPLSFVEIDPRSGRILTTISAPYDDIGYFAVDGDDLWVSNYTLPEVAKVSISRARVVGRYPTGPKDGNGNFGIAVGAGSVWVAQRDGDFRRLDAETGRVQHVFDREIRFPNSVAFGDGAVWVTGGVGELFRVDPATDDVTSTGLPGGGVAGSYVAAGGGYGWTQDESKGVVYQVDTEGRLLNTRRTGDGARSVSFADGTVWIGNQDVGTVTALDVVTGEQIEHAFDHPLQAIAAGDGTVLVQLNPGRTYEDRIDALRGKVARLLVQPYQMDSADPATMSSVLGFQVEYATCAPLLGYGDTDDAPPRLVPEVAEAMPELSADGRTYTFTIRDGFRFSPPSGQPVTAETYRYSIERALSPDLGPGPQFIDDLEGERAFLDGKADHISGLGAEGNRLTITLERPSGSFLARLAMPFFCPVPTDSPIVPGGAVSKLSGAAGRSAVASAGPYYLADLFNGEYDILKRNPNYGGSRPQHLDAIALREGIDAGQAIQRVQDGTWDGITTLYGPSLSPYGPLASDEREGLEFRTVPIPALDYLALNTDRPLFANPDLRRALALAIDRTMLAQPFDEIVTDRSLPPSLWSVPPPLRPPDLAAARRLVDGSKRRGVIATYAGCDPCRAGMEALRATLTRIGIHMTIREVDDPLAEAAKPGTDIDLFNAFHIQDFADPASFLQGALTEDMPSSWLPPGVAGALQRLDDLRGAGRDAATQRLAERLATEEIPVVAFAAGATPSYLSDRLGCQVFPSFGYGVDLAGLCIGDAN